MWPITSVQPAESEWRVFTVDQTRDTTDRHQRETPPADHSHQDKNICIQSALILHG